jgi:hypothetical protein
MFSISRNSTPQEIQQIDSQIVKAKYDIMIRYTTMTWNLSGSVGVRLLIDIW